MFKKFLRAAEFLDEKNKFSKIFELLVQMGYDDPIPWGLAAANLAYNAQCSWYISNMQLDESYQREHLAEMLINEGVSKGDTTSIISAFRRFCNLPLGTVLNFGAVETKGNRIESLTRTKMSSIEPRVLLYSLYRYAKACGGYYQFSLDTLMDMKIQSEGISPVKIFGFTRDEMEAMLRGLSARYNAYIDVTFTHDLDKITLRDYYSSADVLELF